MSTLKRLALVGATVVAPVWAMPAMAISIAPVTGDPCTVGTANCTVVDPDDPSAPGRYTNPNDPVSTTTTNGDTGVVTTSPPAPPPAPTPAPPAD